MPVGSNNTGGNGPSPGDRDRYSLLTTTAKPIPVAKVVNQLKRAAAGKPPRFPLPWKK